MEAGKVVQEDLLFLTLKYVLREKLNLERSSTFAKRITCVHFLSSFQIRIQVF